MHYLPGNYISACGENADDLNRISIRTTLAPLVNTLDNMEQNQYSKRVKSLLKRTVTSSKRRGAWFSLDRKEKGILSLAIRLEVKFSSLELLRAITSVLKKLAECGDTLYTRLQKGIRLAWTFSDFAVRCGNASARSWRHDRSYAEYLGALLTSRDMGVHP
jgi:hypothetical protein